MKINSVLLYCEGSNKLKKTALEIIAHLLPQLQQYIGKKIFIATGLAKSFKVELLSPTVTPIDNGFASLHIKSLKQQYGTTLSLNVSICLNGGKYEDKTYYCQYFDRTYELGKLNGDILESVNTLEHIVEDYGLTKFMDFETEMATIKELKEAEAVVDSIKKRLKIPSDIYKFC